MAPCIRPILAAAALLCAGATAHAWEVVGGGPLPTFAAGPALSAGLSESPMAGAVSASPFAVTPLAANGFNPGYNFRIGRDFLVGVETRPGFTVSNPFATAAGFTSSGSSMKFGYDMGRFKPFVSASFSEIRPPAFGADPFSGPGALARVASPFSTPATVSTVGAGFDYAVTDKLSLRVSVSATQASGGGWAR